MKLNYNFAVKFFAVITFSIGIVAGNFSLAQATSEADKKANDSAAEMVNDQASQSVKKIVKDEMDSLSDELKSQDEVLIVGAEKSQPSKKKKPKKGEPVEAFKGISIGGITQLQSYGIKVGLNVDGTEGTVSAKGNDLVFVGALAKYNDYTFDNIGTEFLVGVGSSVNHTSQNMQSVNMVKLEINFGYPWRNKSGLPAYFFGGIGYEFLQGKDIENLLATGGAGFQGGFGYFITGNVSIEGVYAYTSHAVANPYYDIVKKNAQDLGASSVTFDSGKSKVTSSNIQARFNLKF